MLTLVFIFLEELTLSDLEKFPSDFVSAQFVKYIDKNEIKGMVESLGNTLNQKYAGEELVLIGILKGSVTFLADLVRQLTQVKVYLDFVKLDSIGRTKEHNGTISISKDISTNVLNRHVIIVEEIIDTGRALHFLKQRLLLSGPKKVEIMTLFDKPYKRAVPIKADYIGRQLDDHFVVGYGLDLENYGRNMQELYYLKYPN
jgi:hypoxanthine phosphoribosyltransferase